MRCSLLDIEMAPDRRAPQAATVIRMDIQPGNRLSRRQRDSQLQLCVPLVALKGDSYRLKDRDLGRVPASKGEE
jgi:hypothetical protein